MDKDGYPDDNELKTIEEWDVLKSNVSGLLDFIVDRWRWADRQIIRDENKVELHTGGWSGNEEILGALRANLMFWTLCWMKSERGGHYWFEIPPSIQNIKEAEDATF